MNNREHVLLVYPLDKKEDSKPIKTRLMIAVSTKEIKIQVRDRTYVSAGGVLLRLASKSDVGFL